MAFPGGDAPDEPESDLDLKILQVGASPGDRPDSIQLLIETTRGPIEAMFQPVQGGTGAVLCVGGAMGGAMRGGAGGLYARLFDLLAADRVSVMRLNYRLDNQLEECVLDTLAGVSFLRGIGAEEIVLIGHSFGGAVVIKAGEMAPGVAGVVAMSSQLHGTRTVERLGKPLLLIHGMSDNILSHEASEDIYRRALPPRRMVLFADAGHSLEQAKDEIAELLQAWIPARLAGVAMEDG